MGFLGAILLATPDPIAPLPHRGAVRGPKMAGPTTLVGPAGRVQVSPTTVPVPKLRPPERVLGVGVGEPLADAASVQLLRRPNIRLIGEGTEVG